MILAEVLKKRTASLDVIFNSYNILHGVYKGVLVSAKIPEEKMRLYEKTEKSAREKSEEISESLHTQAFILMTGAVEALLKDIHEDLILENFTKLNNLTDVKFTIGDMKSILETSEQDNFVSLKLAERTIDQLSNAGKNPNEKVNFQNIQSMREHFKRLFALDIVIDDSLVNNLASYWFKRHVLVHSAGITDKRYVSNMAQLGFSAEEGRNLKITKTEYETSKNDFCSMLDCIERELERKNLAFDGIG